jgi:Tol biopolymer transport system component
MELLLLLTERRGELVTRLEIAQRLWGGAVYLNAEQGISNGIRKIRLALRDDPEQPHFIETVVGKGYRLIGPVTVVTRQPRPVEVVGPVPAADFTPIPRLGRHALVWPLVALAIGAGWLAARRLLRPAFPFSMNQVRIRKVTQHGRVGYAGISPDGRYIAYVKTNEGFWLLQVATGSDVQIIPHQPGLYLDSISFSPDGNYIYFGHTAHDNDSLFELYAVPTLGGEVRRVASDVVGAVVSPDGRRFAVVRWSSPKGITLLLVCNRDGSGMRQIAARSSSQPFLRERPAWSPDGKLVAAVASRLGNEAEREIVVVPADGGTARTLAAKHAIGQFEWLGTDGLLAVAFDFTAGFAAGSDRAQIYYLPYRTGEAVRFTSDIHHYTTVSLASRADALVSVQEDPSTTLSVAAAHAPNHAHAIDTGNNVIGEMDWISNQRLVLVDDNLHLAAMDTDGSNRTLLSDQFAVHTVKHCGAHGVLFIRIDANNAASLWILDLKEGGLRQLARGSFNMDCTCSPDGRWAYYTSYDVAPSRLMKIATAGGKPMPIGPPGAFYPIVSPDGEMMLCEMTEEADRDKRNLFAVLKLPEGNVVRRWPMPPGWSHYARWAPDIKGFVYIRTDGERQNLWLQPLGAARPRQITNFALSPNELLTGFAFSPDGKQVAFLRLRENRDAVLFSNFRR